MSHNSENIPDPSTILRPSAGVVARDMGHATVLVHLDSNRIFELNKTGTRIWEWIQEGATPASICQRLQSEFPGATDVDETVTALLAELSREGLVGA